MVKDLKKGTHYRIDKLIDAHIDKKLRKCKNDKKRDELLTI